MLLVGGEGGGGVNHNTTFHTVNPETKHQHPNTFATDKGTRNKRRKIREKM